MMRNSLPIMALAAGAMAAPAPGLWPWSGEKYTSTKPGSFLWTDATYDWQPSSTASAIETPKTVSVPSECPASAQYITVTGSPSACAPASAMTEYVTVTVTEKAACSTTDKATVPALKPTDSSPVPVLVPTTSKYDNQETPTSWQAPTSTTIKETTLMGSTQTHPVPVKSTESKASPTPVQSTESKPVSAKVSSAPVKPTASSSAPIKPTPSKETQTGDYDQPSPSRPAESQPIEPPPVTTTESKPIPTEAKTSSSSPVLPTIPSSSSAMQPTESKQTNQPSSAPLKPNDYDMPSPTPVVKPSVTSSAKAAAWPENTGY